MAESENKKVKKTPDDSVKSKTVKATASAVKAVSKPAAAKKTNGATKSSAAKKSASSTVKPAKNVAKTTTTTKTATPQKELKIEYEVKFKQSVLFVASEANPFAGTGGLADVIGSLPKSLAQRGEYDIRVAIPLYGAVSPAYRAMMRFEGNFNVPVAWRNQYCGLFSLKYEGVTFYFIDNEYYFKRDNLYGYFDDGERFAFFSRAVLEAMRYLDYYPEILHCHDWQTALSVIYLKTIYADNKGLIPFARCLPFIT